MSADEAAATVAGAYGLRSDQQACLASAFDDDPGATEALAVGTEPTRAQLDDLAAALGRCLPVDALADAVAGAAARGLGDPTPEARACLRDAIVALGPPDRALLFAGLVSPGVVAGTGATAAELRALTGRLLDRCAVRSRDRPADPTATTTAGDLGAVPEETSG
jgi:hypothetical protein